MTKNTILCVKWGDKYGRNYVEKLKEQVERNCSIPVNFYCLTDNPTESYDVQLPTHWDEYYNPDTNRFWAYRKFYMFDMSKNFPDIIGRNFLFLDLDVLIHKSLDYFFDLDMTRPWIVKGWWNDPNNGHKNYAKFQSTPLNSSVIRWNHGQLQPIYDHVKKHQETIFFTYPTIDNYFNHHWFDFHGSNWWTKSAPESSFFEVFPQGDIYSFYKGNIFELDMEKKKLREELKICIFNNSHAGGDNEDFEKQLL